MNTARTSFSSLSAAAVPVFRRTRRVWDVELTRAEDRRALALRVHIGPRDVIRELGPIHHGDERATVDALKDMIVRAVDRAEYVNECADGIWDLVDP